MHLSRIRPGHAWSADPRRIGPILGAFLLLGGSALAQEEPETKEPAKQDPAPEAPASEAPEAPAPAPKKVVFVHGDRLFVRPGEVLENGAVLIEDGTIVAVGTDLTAPEGAEIVQGPVVCAGFFDAWSSLGVDRSSASDRSTKAYSLTVDAFDPFGDEFARREAIQSGVVAARVAIGASGNVGGQDAIVRTVPGAMAGDMPYEDAIVLTDGALSAAIGVDVDVFDRIEMVDRLAGELEGGLKYYEDQLTFQEELAAWEKEIAELEAKLEKDFKKAKKDREKDLKEAEEKGKEFKEARHKEPKRPREPRFDAEKAVFARVVNGELPLVLEVHRASELRALLSATRPFPRLRLVIAGGTEAETVAEDLAERRIPVIVYPAPFGTDVPDDRWDGHDLTLAARLAEAKVPVLLGSGGTGAARDLPLLAQLAIGHGLDRELAFHALTLGAARALDVADRLGSVQPGRAADLLVLDGDPLTSAGRVRYVLTGGRVVVAPKE